MSPSDEGGAGGSRSRTKCSPWAEPLNPSCTTSEALEPSLASLGPPLAHLTTSSSAATFHAGIDWPANVPDNWQELVAIPGVGDYIASAVLCFAFGRRSVLMDTNTTRIARRLMGGASRPWRQRLYLHQLAGPKGATAEWNQALLDLGALTCTARAPKCGDCPVRAHCATGKIR